MARSIEAPGAPGRPPSTAPGQGEAAGRSDYWSGGRGETSPVAPALAARYGTVIPLAYGPVWVPGRVVYSQSSGIAKVRVPKTLETGEVVAEEADLWTTDAVIAFAEAPLIGESSGIAAIRRDRDSLASSGLLALADVAATAASGGAIEVTTAADPAAWSHLNAAAAGQKFKNVCQLRVRKLGMIDNRIPDIRVKLPGTTGVDPVAVLLDLCARAGVPSSKVEVDVGPDGLAASSYRRYVQAAVWRVAQAIVSQVSVRDLVASLLLATNSTATWSEGKLKIIPLADRPIGTYSPPTTAAVLDDDELLMDGDSPVQVDTVPDEQVWNAWPITIGSQGSDGAPATYEWIHAGDAAARAAKYGGDGVRRAKTTVVPWLLRPEDALRLSMIWALRSIHIRNAYRVKVGPRWGLLEPGDFVQLRHEVMELDVLCRIRSIDVRDDGRRDLVLEEVPEGVATPVDLTPQAHDGLGGTPVRSPPSDIGLTYADRDLGNVPGGSVTEELLEAGVTKTDPYVETTGIVYPEGTTGTYATSGAKLHNRGDPASVTPVLVSATGIRVGRWRLDEPVVRAANALARPVADSNMSYYRGNSFGAPVLMDPLLVVSTAYAIGDRVLNRAKTGVYRCTTAGTSHASTDLPGTGTGITNGTAVFEYVGTRASQERIVLSTVSTLSPVAGLYIYEFQMVISPRSDDDNLDALQVMVIEPYSSAGASGFGARYVVLPDRKYIAPGDVENGANASRVTVGPLCVDWDLRHASSPFLFNGYLRLAVDNALGRSVRDYGPSPNALGTVWAGGAAIPAVGDPPDPVEDPTEGGFCPSPETPILLPGGVTAPAGALRPGDVVWTLPEDGGPWGEFRISHVSAQHESRRVRLRTRDGRALVVSPLHRVAVPGGWAHACDLAAGDRIADGEVAGVEEAGTGPVVRLTVEGARTYVAGGILSHNAKPRDP